MLTYWSYLLFNKLNFSLNCINSTLLKFCFCFHSMIVFVVSLFLWGDKNGTKSEYILLKFHHFTCLKQKPLKNRLFLTFTITKPKGFVNYSWSKVIQTFIICENWCCYFFLSFLLFVLRPDNSPATSGRFPIWPFDLSVSCFNPLNSWRHTANADVIAVVIW